SMLRRSASATTVAGFAAIAFAIFASASVAEITLPGGARGGPLAHHGPLDEIAPSWRAEVQADLERRVRALLANGAIAPATKAAGVLFDWPVRLIPGAPDRAPNVISNFVDHDPLFPGQVRDWNCGARSYDIASGYNHPGIDIAAFPFGWLKMDHDEMIVLAAAPGTIIRRDDGNFDRNCGTLATVPGNAMPNAIYVRHADGSIAWYLHMKSGSLTPKELGETVAAGERLGSVGSSGFSTGPHLHFEVHTVQGTLVDPYAGTCNTRNIDSWWAQQPAYWQPAVVRLTVHAAVPAFSNCSSADTPNAATYVMPATTFHATIFLRDFLKDATVPVRVLRPDGTTFFEGPVTNTQADFVASYWYYSLALPANAPAGAWRFQADLGGSTAQTVFYVEPVAPARTTAVEYYHAGFGHYFVTARSDEIAGLDGGAFGGVWSRTGRAFPVYASAGEGLAPVCRFFSTAFAPKSSHFYTADPVECEGVKQNPDWSYENIAFHVPMPDGAGTCPANTLPVYRMYNNGQTGAPNHRFTTDYATRLAFAPSLNWTAEGVAATGVGMCAPQ
ncbi:MAG: peptidoglycan DD-metalloendopeptidase family protein, partial [Betaproteobacteria bacterium]